MTLLGSDKIDGAVKLWSTTMISHGTGGLDSESSSESPLSTEEADGKAGGEVDGEARGEDVGSSSLKVLSLR